MPASSLIATVSEPSPCSACAWRSSLSASTSAPADAITVRSDGPANPSMPTTWDTWRLASWTHRLPGPDDHVHARDRLRPVGERGDGLRAGDGVDGIDLAQARRGEQDGMRRRGEDDLVDAGGAGRDRAHDDGVGYGCRPLGA